MVDLSRVFDEGWYLQRYPDVAAAAVDPFEHYLNRGRFEGRWPMALDVVDVARSLWADETALPRLQQLLNVADSTQSQANAELARWELARFHAVNHDWQQVIALLAPLEQENNLRLLRALVPHQGPFLCLFEALFRTAQLDRATRLVNAEHWPRFDDLSRHDHCLAKSMLEPAQSRLECINAIYQTAALAPLHNAGSDVSFDSLSARGNLRLPRFWQKRPRVSVIMPCHNCATTVTTAVNSLLVQSWTRLQIVLVDDASTDDTPRVLAALASKDKRITVVTLSQNEGAYGARNAGLDASNGDFLTTHDADDWSHPDKIACQVYDLLAQPQAVANRSAWVRADNALRFSRWRPESSWIYPNVSSLLFRRKVFKKLGYWDTVKADGDTEFYYRVLAEFGEGSIREVKPSIPLAFGRVSEYSLTQSAATHVRSALGGTRANYQAAASAWHQQARSRYLPRYPNQRPFVAPLSLCRGTPSAVKENQRQQLLRSPLFNGDYYLERYPDVAAAGVDAVDHYLKFGGAEGRDPSDCFSSSGYAFLQGLAPQQNPLLDYLQQQEAANKRDCYVELHDGELPDNSQPLIMVVAHSTVGEAFGAEKSLFDVLAMLKPNFRIWLILPGAMNRAYVKKLQQLSDVQSFLPLRWWQQDRQPDSGVLAQLEDWMASVSLVYVNTLTLWEPLLAARSAKVPTVVHVRELPEHDVALCDSLKATPQQIRAHLLDRADHFIANSATVAAYIGADDRTSIIPNVIDVDAYQTARNPITGSRLRVGMLSSNLAKKGVKDFYWLAEALYNHTQIEWHLFGPVTDALNEAQLEHPRAKVTLHGYVDDPVQALKQLDIVLNLSHFQESFGRSVLEALACGKVVIAYEWGAIPELLGTDAGILVPYRNTEAVNQQLERLLVDQNQYEALQHKAVQRAEQYDMRVVSRQLVTTLSELCC